MLLKIPGIIKGKRPKMTMHFGRCWDTCYVYEARPVGAVSCFDLTNRKK